MVNPGHTVRDGRSVSDGHHGPCARGQRLLPALRPRRGRTSATNDSLAWPQHGGHLPVDRWKRSWFLFCFYRFFFFIPLPLCHNYPLSILHFPLFFCPFDKKILSLHQISQEDSHSATHHRVLGGSPLSLPRSE